MNIAAALAPVDWTANRDARPPRLHRKAANIKVDHRWALGSPSAIVHEISVETALALTSSSDP
jgi:hypothetical protein